jgi:branched-subunit amino acid aminotransferase/4-amino-4-deoxychorismate lyase
MSQVWLDGKYLPEDEAFIPAVDPAFLYGRGLFEVVRGYDGRPFRLRDHLERMRHSARRFGIPFRVPALEPVIRELSRRNAAPDAYVRITLSAMGHLLVHVRPRHPLPAAWYERGAKLLVAPWMRDPRAPLAGHKTLNYFENVLAHEQALRRGYADMLYVGPGDEVLEGCVSNIFLVFGGKIVTPPLGRNILPGVTRRVVMELARVRERVIRRRELREADEVFITNALIEVLPIGKPGPVARRIAEAYRSEVLSLTRRVSDNSWPRLSGGGGGPAGGAPRARPSGPSPGGPEAPSPRLSCRG